MNSMNSVAQHFALRLSHGGTGLVIPSVVQLFAWLFQLAILWTIIVAVYRIWLHPLAKVPGPRLAAVSQLWKMRADWRYRRAHLMLAEHQKYGPVIRVAPNELSFANPAVLQTMYSHKGFAKSDFYAARKMYQEDHLFSTRDPAKHAARRKLAARTFSAKALAEFEPTLNTKVALLLGQWDRRACSGQPLNLFPWLHWIGFEVMMALAFDVDAKILEKGEPHVAMRYLAAWKPAFIYRQTFGHWLNRFGHHMPGFVGRCFADLRAWKAFSLDVVRQARRTDADTIYLSKMLKEPDSFTGKLLNDSQLAEEGMGLMFGGSGTTANTMVTLIYAVLRDPRVKSRLEEEVRAADGAVDGGLLPYSVTSHLPYLNAVLKETFRRYPAIIGSQPRVTTEECVMEGIKIPAGTEVLTTAWTMHHNTQYFPDPDKFDPERWLKDDASCDLNDAFIPFGIGPRACIGRNLAMMELCQIAANFFRRFDATLDASMTDDMFVQNDTFNAQPCGAQLMVHLQSRQN